MKHLSIDQEKHLNQQENSCKLCNEMGHPVLSLLESQWELQQHDQNFSIKGKPLLNKY